MYHNRPSIFCNTGFFFLPFLFPFCFISNYILINLFLQYLQPWSALIIFRNPFCHSFRGIFISRR
nr:hypothetical protein Iba_chr11dCG6810 [Ipomoea batatas]